jgi:hypothetical protein
MKSKICFCLFIILLLYSQIFADISISASVDKNVVSLGEQITLQVVVSGDTTNIPQPKIPQIQDFQIYSSGRSQSISIINGQVNSSITFTYILSPNRVGEFEIPPISVEYKGKIYQTEPIKIKVEKSISTPQKTVPQQQNVYQGKKRGVFIETFVDKHTAYVNEQITLTFRFYTKVNLLSQPQYSPPDTTGFITEDLPPQKNYYTIIDGDRYYVSEIKTALFPTTAGKFVIGAATVRCTIEDFDIDDFFSDNFFRRFFSQGKEVVLKSEPIEIKVLPLPQPQPQFFSGNVGKYTIDVSVDKQKIEQNESTFLNIKISGVGNIKSLTFSKSLVENFLGKNFVIYDSITTFDIKKENYVVKGSKTFKIPISVSSVGKFVIPEIKFVYFNPISKQYETVSSLPITLEVLPSTKQQVVQPLFSKTQSQHQQVSLEDIRYIKSFYKVKNKKDFVSVFILLQFLPILCWVTALGYKKYEERKIKDFSKYRSSRAYKNAKNKLKNIYKSKNVVEEMYDIIAEYLADKMNISKEAVSTQEINRFFKDRVEPKVYNDLVALWEELNFYKFAPSKLDISKINLEEFVKKITNVLQKLEYELQKKY